MPRGRPSPCRARAAPTLAVVLGAACALAATGAGAQPSDLDTDDADALMLAIEGLPLRPAPGAAPALAARVRRGLPEPHLLAAVSALGALGDRRAAPVLFELLAHRRPSVRRLAIGALLALRAPGSEAAFRDALSDRDRRVREAALAALTQVATPASVPTLFAALDRGHPAALAPLARLVDDRGAARILELVGRRSLERLGPALRLLGTRSDLAEDTRVAVVNALAGLGTAAARRWIEAIRDALPRRGGDALREAVAAALGRLPG